MSDTTETMDSLASTRNSSIVPCSACNNNPSNANRFRDLENEVLILRDKAAAAGMLMCDYERAQQMLIDQADKLADYEEEMRHLRGQPRTDSPVERSGSLAIPERPDITRNVSAPTVFPTTGRFSFLQSSRKPLPTPPANKGDFAELEAALARETHLREEAEKKVTDTENEIEDLSATLFEQANEMVATERRARAELEAKLARLEQKDKERSKRLDRIDEAMKRLERVKSLLAP